MLKVIVFSVAALVVIWLVSQSLGLTPQQVEERILLAEMNAEEGDAYRVANSRRASVIVFPSGLQLEVLREGFGPVPEEQDWVLVHYQGWHIDGREFENSWRRGEPATVTPNRTIPGWREALTVAPVGSLLRLVIPPELAYGRAGGGRIGPEETLVFELELLAIVPPDPVPVPPAWERPVPGL